MTGLYDTVYITYPRKCDLVRLRHTTDRCVPSAMCFSPETAWGRSLEIARDCGVQRPDPAECIIVPAARASDVNERGAHLILLDWANAIDPMSFEDEIRIAEEQMVRR